MSGKKVGLALGGGAARGFAHIGVLAALEAGGVPIDLIAGTSIGAIVGAFYAHTKDTELMKKLAVEVGSHRLHYIFSDVTFPRTGLIRLGRVEQLLKGVIGGVRFQDLKLPLACVAVDIDSGQEIVLDRGLVWEAARASAAVPVIVALKKVEGRNLVDGGLLDPLPTTVARRMGADLVIAVNLVPARPSRPKRSPGIFTLMMKTLSIVGHSPLIVGLANADIVIEPEMDSIEFTDFQLAEECFLLGQTAAERALPEIRRMLASD
jgi:NTE family protein